MIEKQTVAKTHTTLSKRAGTSVKRKEPTKPLADIGCKKHNMIIFGANLRKFRKRAELTTDEMSELIGVSTSFVGLVERGERQVSISVLTRLAQLFHVKIDDFFTDTQTPDKDTLSEKDSLINSIHIILSAKSENTLKMIHEIILVLIKLR